jgi:hypothetical protein
LSLGARFAQSSHDHKPPAKGARTFASLMCNRTALPAITPRVAKNGRTDGVDHRSQRQVYGRDPWLLWSLRSRGGCTVNTA